MTTDLTHAFTLHGIVATLRFSVSAPVFKNNIWKEIQPGRYWESRMDGLCCTVKIQQEVDRCIYQLIMTNDGDSPLNIENFSMGPESVSWKGGLVAPHALYSLHPRVTGVNDYDADEVLGLPPLAPLPENEWHLLSERCPELPHLEALVLSDGWDRPAFIEGPLSQNHAHQRKKIRWTGNDKIEFDITHRFMGIPARNLAPGETIRETGFVQFRPDGDLNCALRDYLLALAASTGTRGETNPLIKERFFCTWNNFIYWEANEKELLPSVARVKEALPSNQWYLLDDGYMVSEGSKSVMDRNEKGERIHTLEKELPWFHNCPGISFLFDGGAGIDSEKFPDGLDGFARKVKSLGMRPGIWLGFETSKYAPVAVKHPEWFIDIGHESHLIPDLSVPEVRQQLRKAFKTIFHDWGFKAVKTDFITHLTDHPKIRYRFPEKSGAEWREWLFSTLREYLPEDGFLSIGCWICMGAPWHARHVDSYRDSMDARDGNWQTVLSNVRWSIVPSLTGGSGQPIPDADSVSIFKGMAWDAMKTWINYARVGGMLVEAGGDILRWTEEEVQWVDQCLANDTSGGRVYFADKAFWNRDGLPCASYRAIEDDTYLVGLYNWSENAAQIHPEWIGPIATCKTFTCVKTGEPFTRGQLSPLHLPARDSRLFLAKPETDTCP